MSKTIIYTSILMSSLSIVKASFYDCCENQLLSHSTMEFVSQPETVNAIPNKNNFSLHEQGFAPLEATNIFSKNNFLSSNARAFVPQLDVTNQSFNERNFPCTKVLFQPYEFAPNSTRPNSFHQEPSLQNTNYITLQKSLQETEDKLQETTIQLQESKQRISELQNLAKSQECMLNLLKGDIYYTFNSKCFGFEDFHIFCQPFYSILIGNHLKNLIRDTQKVFQYEIPNDIHEMMCTLDLIEIGIKFCTNFGHKNIIANDHFLKDNSYITNICVKFSERVIQFFKDLEEQDSSKNIYSTKIKGKLEENSELLTVYWQEPPAPNPLFNQ